MNESVVIIVGLFFIIGITVGIIAVIALSALRADRWGGPDSWPGCEPGGSDEQPPDTDWGSTVPDNGPRWPGDADRAAA